MKKKLSVLVMLILALSILFALPISANAESGDGFYYDEYDGCWYFYRDGVMATEEVIEYGDYLYAFNEWGRMYENQRFELYSEEEERWCYYCAGPGGALYENEWYWDKWNEDWYYYGENGAAPSYELMTVNGALYYFEYGGRMLADGAASVWEPETGTEAWYAFDENGAAERLDVSTAGWVWCNGNWYYVEKGEYGGTFLACNELLNINGTEYLFGNNYVMATNEFVSVWDDETWEYDYYYANEYGMPHKGWIQPYANETNPNYDYRKNYWYYFGADGKALEGYQVIGGTGYYFYGDGRMATNDYDIVREDYDDPSTWWAWSADKNGALSWTYHGWLKYGDSWFYFDTDAYDGDWSYSCFLRGYQELDGGCYYFNGYTMLNDGTYDGYRAKEGGRLYQSEWYEEDGEWYYYDYQCQLLRNTVIDLYGNGTYYAFGSSGYMLKDRIVSDGYGFEYILDKNGVGTRVTGTGWYQIDDRWAYAEDGNLIYGYGLYTIDGSEYYFDGYYILQDTCYDGYLLSAGGQKITTPGWHIVNGEYYYVKDSSGALADYGWYEVDGKYYYFWPEMAHNTIIEDHESGYVYAFDTNGNYFQVTGDGFYTSYPGFTMYVKDSKLVMNTWEWIDGYWYYFDEYGWKVEGPWYVDGTLYLFDSEGRLVYDNWYTYDGYYYYSGIYRSDASGKVLTGYQYVDGKYYLFNEDGYLFPGGIVYQDGWTYLLYDDGSVYGYEFTPNTWYFVDGEWYYFGNGYFLEGETEVIDGYEYAFDYSGQMVTDRYFSSYDEDMGYYHEYYYDAAGHKLVNAWLYTTSGYKYFDEDGDDYYWDYYTIDGVEYYFYAGYLKVGTFRDDDGNLVTTTGGGAVISKTPMPEGWTYADGTFYYVEDGSYYTTGWVGPYYVESGRMIYGSVIYDHGDHYYINGSGVCVTGWYNLGSAEYPAYIYADADGTLKYNEWADIGGVRYYFDGTRMCADGRYYIDGETHEFAESGAWLGKVEENTGHNGYANGWVYLDGEYYYSYNGRFLEGDQYIDGKWYCFVYGEGRMLADVFTYTYDGYGESIVYYTASGALFEGTGWQVINGKYVYFDTSSRVKTGLIDVYGTKYYITGKYINEDTDDEQYIYYMASNGYVMYDGKLYYASASGALSEITNPNGWYWIDRWEAYVYYQNGTLLCDGEHVVNGVAYYFWYDGEMATDYVNNDAYYDASGAKVTGTGWYWSENYEGGWVYVNEGKLYRDGLYYINGVAYYFNYSGLWVQ